MPSSTFPAPRTSNTKRGNGGNNPGKIISATGKKSRIPKEKIKEVAEFKIPDTPTTDIQTLISLARATSDSQEHQASVNLCLSSMNGNILNNIMALSSCIPPLDKLIDDLHPKNSLERYQRDGEEKTIQRYTETLRFYFLKRYLRECCDYIRKA